MEGTESKLVGRGCSVVVGVAGSRSLSMDAPLFVERDSVRNDGVDAHRARGASLFRLRQQQHDNFLVVSRFLVVLWLVAQGLEVTLAKGKVSRHVGVVRQ